MKKTGFLAAIFAIAALLFYACGSYDCIGVACDNDDFKPSSSSRVLMSSSSSRVLVSSSAGKGNDIANYRIVRIGDQVWMAENLNYAVEGSKCYNNQESYCNTYGRLYNWPTAKTVCPSGWHLPTMDEWDALAAYIESANGCGSCDAKHLKAASGWNSSGNGLDTYGFSALPGGDGFSDGLFSNAGYSGYWWSASEYSSKFAYYRLMYYDGEDANWGSIDKSYLFSVRCVQDNFSVTLSSSSVMQSSSSIASSSSAAVLNFSQIKFSGNDTLTLNSKTGNRGVVFSAARGTENISEATIYYDGNAFVAGSNVKIITEFRIAPTYSGNIFWSASPAEPEFITNPQNTSQFKKSSGAGESRVEISDGGMYFMIRTAPSGDEWNSGDYLVLISEGMRLAGDNRTIKILAWKVGDTPSSSSSVLASSSSRQSGTIYGTPVTYEGKTYKTVVVGTQTWMAENLNYAVEGSKCYGNSEANCDTYGRLYDWSTAMTICPSGWHLPSNADWNKLMHYVDGTGSPYDSPNAGIYLKATSGWSYSGNGQDTYGFSALPGGYGGAGYFLYAGDVGYWWSAGEDSSDGDYYRSMGYDYEGAFWGYGDKSLLFSVRCVQD